MKVDLENLRELQVPAIIHWDMNHFVVLKSVQRNKLTIHDPAVGIRSIGVATASRHYTGVALELWPARRFDAAPSEPVGSATMLLGSLKDARRFFAKVAALTICVQIVGIAIPLYSQFVIDEVLGTSNLSLLALATLVSLAIALLFAALSWIRSWAIIHFTTLLSMKAQRDLLAHILRLPATFFVRRHIGDVSSRFNSASVILSGISNAAVSIVADAATLLFSAFAMSFYDPKLSLVAILVLVAYAVWRVMMAEFLRSQMEENLLAAADNNTYFLESLRGIQTVKLYGLENVRIEGWLERFASVTNTNLRIAKAHLALGIGNKLLATTAQVGVLFWGASLVIDGRLSIGMLVAFVAYQAQFVLASSSVIDQWAAVRLLRVHMARLTDVVMEPIEEAQSPTGTSASLRGTALVLEDVAFQYSSAEGRVLSAVDIEVPDGGCAILLGASGAGKSTLLRIAAGLEKPTSGRVSFGGVPLAQLGRERFRDNVAAVTESDTLLTGSIAQNIALFSDAIDLERVRQCAVLAGIDEAIAAMPMGYHSYIGDMGDALSAGERQRVLLARALYRTPRLLILDEATSHLDPTLERSVNSTLAALKITRLIATHRTGELEYADRVYRLENGRALRVK